MEDTLAVTPTLSDALTIAAPPEVTPVLSTQPPKNHGLDYEYLRTEGVRLCQQLSSATWTDYNEHDPGVTTLEQLCYALTELSYRAEFPVADLLTDRKSGKIDARNHALFPARNILPCNPVTVNDYRKLIVDRVHGLGNVWLTPRTPEQGSHEVNGLYDICVYYPDVQEHHDPGCGPDPYERKIRRILKKVRRVYSHHRNLCEDVRFVRMLRPERTRVFADVSVRGSETVEKILADIFFALGQSMAPEVTRKPLSSLVDAGVSPDAIFNGPLLLRGFIDDQELQPRAAGIAVNDLIRAIAQTPGVVAVKNVEVRTEHGAKYGANTTVPIPARKFLRLDTRPREAKAGEDGLGFTIRLTKNGAICTPDPTTVAMHLAMLWSAYRRAYPLDGQYEEYFGMPKGQWRDVARYYSIQNQYPVVYGIGWYGLPVDATVERRGQAKQLKGYLLAFEQLMSNYFAQLAEVGDLFSLNPSEWRTYFCQSLIGSVPDVAPLLTSDYEQGLEAIVSGEDTMLQRRIQFTGFLLSLYANELNAITDNSGCRPDRSASERLLRARTELLRLLVPATRYRGRGIDYRAERSPRNIAGMEMKCRIEMGLDLERHRPFSETLALREVKFVSGASGRPLDRDEGRHSGYVEDHFLPVTTFPEPKDVPAESSLVRGLSVGEEFIGTVQDPSRLYVGRLPGDDAVAIAYKNGKGAWVLVDVQPDLESALREAHSLSRSFREINRSRTQLYIVEHNLLRFGRRKRRHGHRRPDDFPYSFTITAVVGLPSNMRRDRNNRRIVEEIVRENTPAHIVAEVCFLDPCRLLRFEHLYWVWRGAMFRREPFAIALTSARLRRFLERQRTVTAAA